MNLTTAAFNAGRDNDRANWGGMNYVGHRKSRVRGMWKPTKESPNGMIVSNDDVDRDWIISDRALRHVTGITPRLAWDKAHLHVVAEIEVSLPQSGPVLSKNVLSGLVPTLARRLAAGLQAVSQARCRTTATQERR